MSLMDWADRKIELTRYGAVYLDGRYVGDLDYDDPGEGRPFIQVELVNLNAAEFKALAEFLDALPPKTPEFPLAFDSRAT